MRWHGKYIFSVEDDKNIYYILVNEMVITSKRLAFAREISCAGNIFYQIDTYNNSLHQIDWLMSEGCVTNCKQIGRKFYKVNSSKDVFYVLLK